MGVCRKPSGRTENSARPSLDGWRMEWPATRLPALPIQVRVSEALRPVWVVGVFFFWSAAARRDGARRAGSAATQCVAPLPTVVARNESAPQRPDPDEAAAGFVQSLQVFCAAFPPWHGCLGQGFKKRTSRDDRGSAHRVSSWGDRSRCRAACAMDQGGCTAVRRGRGASANRASAVADGQGGPPAAGRPRRPRAAAGLPFL